MSVRAALCLLSMTSATTLPTLIPAQAPAPSPAAGPYMPIDHWTRDAIRRLAALGLVDAGDALRTWPIRRSEVRSILRSAADQSASPAIRETAGRELHHFDREFPAVVQEAGGVNDSAVPAIEVRAMTGWSGNAGTLLGGTAFRGPEGRWNYPGPVARASVRTVFAGGELDVTWRGLAVTASGSGTTDSGHIDRLYAAMVAGPVDIWIGRRELASGTGRTGSIVLSPDVPFDGAGMRTARAIDLPGFLGSARAALLLARTSRSGNVERPWFSAATLTVAPSASFRIGFNRAVIFGGDGNVESLSARNLVLMLFGITGQLGKDSGFENQVASIDIWTRTRLAGLPLSLYGEVGVDDVGFSLLSTAALLAGIEVPAMPGYNALAMGIEYARFPRSCCGHPPWYRHGDLADGWTDQGRLLGHPLGGEGSEVSLNWSIVSDAARFAGLWFVRTRGEENLFAPDRTGTSAGAAARVDAPLSSRLSLRARLGAERGSSGWTAWDSRLALDVILGPVRPAN
jgi:hypothetical protein